MYAILLLPFSFDIAHAHAVISNSLSRCSTTLTDAQKQLLIRLLNSCRNVDILRIELALATSAALTYD